MEASRVGLGSMPGAMASLESMLVHVAPLAVVMSRVAGLVVSAPLLSARAAPRRVRVMLAVMLAVALYPCLPAHARTPPDVTLAGLVPLIVSEVLIGVVLGVLASVPVLLLDAAGFIAGHQMGLGLARVYNPDLEVEADLLGQLLMYVGLGVFVAVGGLEVLLAALVETFRRVPPGALVMRDVPLDVLLGLLASGTDLALRVAAPVTAVILLLMIAMGFVMKTVPQINVLSVGFPVKIVCGVGMLTLALGTAQQGMADEIEYALRVVWQWAADGG